LTGFTLTGLLLFVVLLRLFDQRSVRRRRSATSAASPGIPTWWIRAKSAAKFGAKSDAKSGAKSGLGARSVVKAGGIRAKFGAKSGATFGAKSGGKAGVRSEVKCGANPSATGSADTDP